MKETYTFKWFRALWARKEDKTEKELIEALKEDQLSKGYLPIDLRTEIRTCNATRNGLPIFDESIIGNPQEMIFATCVSAYFGKKKARENFEKVNAIKLQDNRQYIT